VVSAAVRQKRSGSDHEAVISCVRPGAQIFI